MRGEVDLMESMDNMYDVLDDGYDKSPIRRLKRELSTAERNVRKAAGQKEEGGGGRDWTKEGAKMEGGMITVENKERTTTRTFSRTSRIVQGRRLRRRGKSFTKSSHVRQMRTTMSMRIVEMRRGRRMWMGRYVVGCDMWRKESDLCLTSLFCFW